MGTAAAYGTAKNLTSAEEERVSTMDLTIDINDKGVFQNVTMDGQTYTLDQYRELNQSKPAGPLPRNE